MSAANDRLMSQVIARLRELEQEVAELRLRDAEPTSWIRADVVEVSVFRTPVGGIPARVVATLGFATCTRVSVADGTRVVTSDTDTIYNDFLSAMQPDVDVIAVKADGVWIVQAEDCS